MLKGLDGECLLEWKVLGQGTRRSIGGVCLVDKRPGTDDFSGDKTAALARQRGPRMPTTPKGKADGKGRGKGKRRHGSP